MEQENLLRRAREMLDQGDLQALRVPDDISRERLIEQLQTYMTGLNLQQDQLRRLNRALDSSKSRYLRFFERAPFALLELDGHCTIREANPLALQIIGLEAGSIAERRVNFLNLIEDGSREELKHLFDRIAREREPREHRLRMSVEPGQSIPARAFITPVLENSGGPAFVCALVDDSAHSHAEAAVREMEARYHALINNPTDLILRYEPDSLVTFANAAYCKRRGCEIGSLVGHRLLDRLDGSARTRLGERLAILAGQPQTLTYVESFPAADGSVLWEHWALTPVLNDDGTILEIQALGRDITRERLMEQRFTQVERFESLSRMAGTIAHDLNNLLAPVRLGAQMLRRALDQPKDREIVEMIESSIGRAGDLVEQISVFSNGLAGERRPLRIEDIVSELRAQLSGTLAENIDLEVSIEDELPRVMGNAKHLYQVFANTARAAASRMEATSGKLSINVAAVSLDESTAAALPGIQGGDCVRLDFADDAPPIPPDELQRIFEPDFSIKKSEQEQNLGLAAASRIVRDHQGYIEAHPLPGNGTAFSIYLPAVEPASPQQAPAGASAPPAPEAPPQEIPAPNPGPGGILLVDDEKPILHMLEEMLRFHGYTVAASAAAEEAYRLFREDQSGIDLVVVDMMMPSQSGPALARRLLEHKPGLHVIFMSGAANFDQRSPVEGVPNAHFLPKPFREEELLKAIRAFYADSAS